NWRHVAVTFSPSGSALYLDGTLQGTGTGPALHGNSGVALAIGAWSGDGAGFLTGTMDDVAIWDQPLSDSQIQQLSAQTPTPLQVAQLDTAVYFAGSGQVTGIADPRRTQLPLGPTTCYFRKNFQFDGDRAQTELSLGTAVEDGAVFYLNGLEVYRSNMPQGEVSYGTPALAVLSAAPYTNGIVIPATNLVTGTNVLAVEVHLGATNAPGMVFGASLATRP